MSDDALNDLYNRVWNGYVNTIDSPLSPSSPTGSPIHDYSTATSSSARIRPPRPLPPTPAAVSPSTDSAETSTITTGRRLPTAPGDSPSIPNGVYPNAATFRPPGAQAPATPGHPTTYTNPHYTTQHHPSSPTSPYQNHPPHPAEDTVVPGPSDLTRHNSATSYATDHFFSFGGTTGPSGSQITRRPTDLLAEVTRGPLELHEEAAAPEDQPYWDQQNEDEDDYEEDDSRFVDFSLLSHIAVQLRDKVPRGTHVKGSIPYPRAFTGKDIVTTIQTLIQRELAINHGVSTNDRRAALHVARSLQSQLFFYEVEWLQDGVEEVYMFLDDQDGPSDGPAVREELPTGVVMMLTKCYSPCCGEGGMCYASRCPRNGDSIVSPTAPVETHSRSATATWTESVPREVIASLPDTEINRQTIIRKLISKEEQYIQDLDVVETLFIHPLRTSDPPILPSHVLDDIFGNILDLRECNRRLLEVLYVRQREQSPVIQRMGDVFLDAATEFREVYPVYIGHHPVAEKRMKDEVEGNPEFRLFIEQCSRQAARAGETTMRFDLKHFLNRPAEHLQKYPVLLEAILNETAEGNPDVDFLKAAIGAIRNLQTVAQLWTFQAAMARGAPGRWEWGDLVSREALAKISRKEQKRQNTIWELISKEMEYVRDLETIETLFVRPLRTANPPILPPHRLDSFITDVFHNFTELYAHHKKLLDKLHEIQREEHPTIRSVTAPVLDAALNFRDAYMEYIPNYPIAEYRIKEERANNLPFDTFVRQATRHPDAFRLDLESFVNRPIPKLLRYSLLLKSILDETPAGHDDRGEIPQCLEVINALAKDTDAGIASTKQKVEVWSYNSSIVFKQGEHIDMDLLDENRSLIFSGKLLRQPDSGLEWNGWSELFVLLFDNYLVMTKPREKDGVTKHHVSRRPIPLDLLHLSAGSFDDPPTQRGAGLLRTVGLRSDRNNVTTDPSASTSPSEDSRSVYPFSFYHNGRLGGSYILYAESAQVRKDWKRKLEEAKGLRNAVQDSNKVFEVETLSTDTFLVPGVTGPGSPPAWNEGNSYTGKVTCSVPFNTSDGRGLVAVGCAEGVWIGFRHDSRSMRRVLHLKMVTQCAMLEGFGIFLVLADKSLFAYHIEALVPSSPQTAHTAVTPQKLNGNKDVHFFSVGKLQGRTLVIYMKKKGLDSVFHVVEPVTDKIQERGKGPAGFGSRLGFRSAKSEWFRSYREFFLPSESYDLIFLKANIAILCTKGFEIMNLQDYKSVTIPQREDPKHTALAKRCEACKPLGMFRSLEDEFLLVYDEFGVYVNKHGDPNRDSGTIEWEGTAEKVALHHPYILLFDTRFIEIRHVETGRLAQIIPGHDVHCIWDGRGAGMPQQAEESESSGHVVQEARVHGVMESTSSRGGRAGGVVAQHVFELIPTIPLYLPGSLASPATVPYIGGDSNSPPQSPSTRVFWGGI